MGTSDVTARRAALPAGVEDQPVWTEGTVMDAVSNVLASLLAADALQDGIDYRGVVADALAAAGIEPGAIR